MKFYVHTLYTGQVKSVEGRAKGGRGDSNHDELRLFQRADKKLLQHFQEFGFYFVFLIGREF